MSIPRWNPSPTCSKQEELLLSRQKKSRKLIAFLRLRRHELFNDAFQTELEGMYRPSGAGKAPVCPAVLAMATLLQAYFGISDAEAVELTIVDLRWQMVLDCLGSQTPAFSQGALADFRARMIRTDMDKRLLERTVELARDTEGFDWSKLPKTLRVALDSCPLEGAGRVEDTVNLLAHAGRKIVNCVAFLLKWTTDRVCREAGIMLLTESSVKKALDYTWSDPADKAAAVSTLVGQLTSLEKWTRERLSSEMDKAPLQEHIETLHQLIAQDIEPDPGKGGGVRVRAGVAPDRRVSVEDRDMRHGRKSKSKKFNGFKRHIATDLDSGLILAVAITLANRPEEDAAADLDRGMHYLGREIGGLYIDRAYINAPLVVKVQAGGGTIVCRPWAGANGKLYPKRAFSIDVEKQTITCPAKQTAPITFGTTVEFDPEVCDRCSQRDQCTDASLGHGRTVAIAENELLQHRLRRLASTSDGRSELRERVAVEHSLAHVGRRQGTRARYIGARKNLFDVRRASTVTNLETIQRKAA